MLIINEFLFVVTNSTSCSAEFPLFPGLWLVEQFPCVCRPTASPKYLMKLLWGLHHSGLQQSVRPHIRVCIGDKTCLLQDSNVWSDGLLQTTVGSAYISGAPICQVWASWTPGPGLTNRWLVWAQIWWANLLQASPGLINVWSYCAEFP